MPSPRKKPGLAGLSEQLLLLSREAKKLSDGLRADRPSVDVVRSAQKIHEAATLLLQSGELTAIKDKESADLKAAMEELPDRLREYCAAKGINLSGAFPDFIIDGIVYLKLKSSDGIAIINGSNHPAFPFEQLAAAVLNALQQLTMVKHTSGEVVERLWTAYSVVLQQRIDRERLRTQRVGVYEILPQMALLSQTSGFRKNPTREQFRTYSQHNLRADLFTLMQTELPVSYRGSTLVLEPTSVADDGLFMYLPSLQRCGYIGHISFVSTDAEGVQR